MDFSALREQHIVEGQTSLPQITAHGLSPLLHWAGTLPKVSVCCMLAGWKLLAPGGLLDREMPTLVVISALAFLTQRAIWKQTALKLDLFSSQCLVLPLMPVLHFSKCTQSLTRLLGGLRIKRCKNPCQLPAWGSRMSVTSSAQAGA